MATFAYPTENPTKRPDQTEEEFAAEMRAKGFRQVTHWVPDMTTPAIAEDYKSQLRRLAEHQRKNSQGTHRPHGRRRRGLGVKRGDIVTAAPPGEFGKPRPVIIIQAFLDHSPERITVALITSHLLNIPRLRVPVIPSGTNGLTKLSEIAVDNLQTFSVKKIGSVIGSLDSTTMDALDDALRLYLGLYCNRLKLRPVVIRPHFSYLPLPIN